VSEYGGKFLCLAFRTKIARLFEIGKNNLYYKVCCWISCYKEVF
jgi:hypothetical protein